MEGLRMYYGFENNGSLACWLTIHPMKGNVHDTSYDAGKDKKGSRRYL